LLTIPVEFTSNIQRMADDARRPVPNSTWGELSRRDFDESCQ
jgi:hypothetical protein